MAVLRSDCFSSSGWVWRDQFLVPICSITRLQGACMAIPLPTLDLLDAITIPTPCDVPWGEMRGDNRSRLCGQCQRQVFDLSAISSTEATELLRDPTNRPCVRLYRRPDGRVLTADCPVGLRARVWRGLRRRSAWVASLFAMLFLPACKSTIGMVPQDYQAYPPALLQTDQKVSSDEAVNAPQPAQK